MGPVVAAVKGGRIGWQRRQAAVVDAACQCVCVGRDVRGWPANGVAVRLCTARRYGNPRNAPPCFARLGRGKKGARWGECRELQRTQNCFADGRENVPTLAIHERQVNGCMLGTGRNARHMELSGQTVKLWRGDKNAQGPRFTESCNRSLQPVTFRLPCAVRRRGKTETDPLGCRSAHRDNRLPAAA
jgi:hypothetical protein